LDIVSINNGFDKYGKNCFSDSTVSRSIVEGIDCEQLKINSFISFG